MSAGSAVDAGDREPGPGIDRSPARLSAVAAIGAALLALATVGTASVVAFSLGSLGAATAVGGVVAGRRAFVTAGAAVLFLAVLAAGVAGTSALRVLVATGAAVFAWDVGRAAVDVGVQLGAAAETTGIELVHAGASLLVVAVAGGVGYAVFRIAAGGRPVIAVVALLVAGALLTRVLE